MFHVRKYRSSSSRLILYCECSIMNARQIINARCTPFLMLYSQIFFHIKIAFLYLIIILSFHSSVSLFSESPQFNNKNILSILSILTKRNRFIVSRDSAAWDKTDQSRDYKQCIFINFFLYFSSSAFCNRIFTRLSAIDYYAVRVEFIEDPNHVIW